MAKQAPKQAPKRATKHGVKPAAGKAVRRRASKKAGASDQPKRASPRAPAAHIKQGRVDALTQVFTALGAQHPSTWARSHVEGGYDELGRFVLLRALWLKTVEPGRLLGLAKNEREVANAVDRLLATASLADLDAVVRFAQKQALLDLCTVLDDPAASDEGIGWAVFRTDGRGLPLWALDRLAAGLTDSEPR